MPTEYLHSLTIVAPIAEVPAVRALFELFDGDGEGIPLSLALTEDGSSATHYAGHTAIKEATRQSLLALMGSGGRPTGTHYMIVPNDPAGQVVGSSYEGFDPPADSEPWALYQAMGLSVYDPVP